MFEAAAEGACPVLTVLPGTWAPAPVTLTYQWMADGTAILGATASTYKAAGGDAGKRLTVTVTGTKTGYTTAAKTSAATVAVAALPSLTARVPTITGSPKVDSTLTAVPGIWGPAPVTLTYQWYAGGILIPGAVLSTYKASTAYVGKTLTVTGTGTKTGYTPAAKTSVSTAAVAKGSLVPAVPTITGYARVGSTLKADPGTWGPAPVTLKYRWYRSGVIIIGANTATYKPTASDLTKILTVKVTGSRSGYNIVPKTSAGTAKVTMGLVGPDPMISAASDAWFSTLTAYAGTWSPSPVTLRYQWYRNGVAVIGGTTATFTPDWDDLWEKRLLTVRVTASKTGYTTASKTSLPYRTWTW